MSQRSDTRRDRADRQRTWSDDRTGTLPAGGAATSRSPARVARAAPPANRRHNLRRRPAGRAQPTTRCWQAVAAVIIAGTTAATTSCAPAPPPAAVTLTKDTVLSERIARIHHDRATVRLHDLTDHPWHHVRIFHEPVTRDYIQRTIGTPIHMPDIFTTRGHILVFTNHDGTVVRTVYTTPNNLTPGHYSNQVMLRPHSQPGTPTLRLTDPVPPSPPRPETPRT
ncbi:hypothetical protein ACN27F_03465 [Solwaraspora sp. WMMB335]|uniref:hypothetical protein n=1 Tax=Solwaraspora sp. WMMB335 TaxID=3404118 RepID=UPI003B92659C